MSARVLRHPLARSDIIETAVYIAGDDEAVAGRYLDAVDSTLARLAEMPEIGSPREFKAAWLRDLRVWPVAGFEKHLIFYRPIDDGIEVMRVLHGARDLENLLESEG